MVAYNQVLNAFIDALPFDKIPAKYKNDTSLESHTSHDGVCAAVRKMTLDWQNLWGRNENNFEKLQIIEKVEDAKDLLIREQENRELIDETHITQLLSDMLPEFKDGAYNKILSEREVFLVNQMAQFLHQINIPVPLVITQYFTQLRVREI